MNTRNWFTWRNRVLLSAVVCFGAACIDDLELLKAIHEHPHEHGGSPPDAGPPAEDAGPSTPDAGAQPDASCQPSCETRACGSDGCGGTCDPGCASDETCSADGQCVNVCTPRCQGRECGADGCGGTCGPGCGDEETCDSEGVCQAPQLTFDAVWAILSTSRCPSCHSGSSPPQGLNLDDEDTAFAQLVNVAARECTSSRARVVPGDPDDSYIINKLEGTQLCAGQRMPLGGPFLSQAQIDVVRAWITDGALR